MVALLVVLSSSCAWERKIVFKSGDGMNAVEVRQPWPANGWGMEVRIVTPKYRQTLLKMRGDAFLDFAEVYWSKGDRQMVMVICGTPSARLGFDLINRNELPFEPWREAMKQTIANHYFSGKQKPTDLDDWCTSSEARDAFIRAHPGAISR
jgi:hypothetical protein